MSAARTILFAALAVPFAGAARAADGPVTPLFHVRLDPRPTRAEWLPPSGDRPAALLLLRDSALEWIPLDRLKAGDTTPVARIAPPPDETCAIAILHCAHGARVVTISANGTVDLVDGEHRATLFRDAQVRLPAGIYMTGFARDLDGDGDEDLALPHLGGLQLWFDDGEKFRAGPVVRQKIDVAIDIGDPNDPRGDVSRRETIAGFSVDDQNGDGRPDLMFKDGDRLQFFWSGADGALPAEPTFELDLEAIKNELPAVSKDVIDPSNLLKLLDSQVSHQTRDLDGDGCDDLLLREGRKVVVYRGTKTGVDRSKAEQVLKTGGNLLAAFSFDDNGDGRDDLALLCMADVSLAQVVMWLVAGTDLDFDLFTYHQDSALRFARKPSRRRSLRMSLPSAISIQNDLKDDLDALGDVFSAAPAVADFDGDGTADDVIVPLAAERAARIFLDVTDGKASDPIRDAWRSTIARFDREAGDDGAMSIDLKALFDWAPVPGRALLDRVKDKAPALEIALPPRTPDASAPTSSPAGAAVYHGVDIDGDGRADVIAAEQDAADGPVTLTAFSTAGSKRGGN